MKNMLKKVVLGAALVAGTLGLGATQAKAAVRIVVGGPVAYVPPCPGPGYFWTAGYYNAGIWVPGFWRFRGSGVGVGFVAHRDFRGPYYFHPDRFHADRRFGPAPYRR